MDNKTRIAQAVKNQGLEMGCYELAINKLSKKAVAEIIDSITGDSTDIAVNYGKTKYVIEIGVVDNEVDFNCMKLTDYISRYGEEYAEKFE